MVNIERIVLYVIVIVVGLVLLGAQFLPGGQFEKAKGAFNKVKSYLPDVGIGAEVLHAEKPAIPQEHRQSLVSLQAAIQEVLYSEKRKCFSSYQPFSELGEKGTTIDLEYNAAGGDTKVVIRRGKIGQQQDVTDETFNIIGMKPCVIAGATSVVDNFDHAFLNRKEGVPPSYFTEANFIRIMYDAPWFDSNGNKIAFGNSPDQLTEFHDFEGDGWIFTPDINRGNKHICFFPTTDGFNSCAARGGLLDDDCFNSGGSVNVRGQATVDEATARAEQEATKAEQQRISIPNLVAGGSLDQC